MSFCPGIPIGTKRSKTGSVGGKGDSSMDRTGEEEKVERPVILRNVL